MLYSSADLLQRCRDEAQLPTDDEAMDDDAWFRLLTAAQATWVAQLAAHVPRVLFGAPVLLESDDGGLTYGFGTDEDGRPIVPYAVRVYRTEADAWDGDASPLDAGGDYLAEGSLLRFRLTGVRPSFPDGGPWVRLVEPPGVIDDTHEPTLLPVHARELLVLTAVERWAGQGDLRSAAPWAGRAQKLWSGDPANPADVGLLGALKLQYPPPASGRRGLVAVVPRWYPGGRW